MKIQINYKAYKRANLVYLLVTYLLPRIIAWGAVSQFIAERLLGAGFFSYLIAAAVTLPFVYGAPYIVAALAIYASVIVWDWNIVLSILVLGWPLLFALATVLPSLAEAINSIKRKLSID